MGAKSSASGKSSSGLLGRLVVLLLLGLTGFLVWYWWQKNDPVRKERLELEDYIDVDRLKEVPVAATNLVHRVLTNDVWTNLPVAWSGIATNFTPATTNRPAPAPVRTNLPTVRPAPLTNAPGTGTVATAATSGSRPAQTILEAQIGLARLGFSPGSIDGAVGSQTRAALRGFQQRQGLPRSGELDAATRARLLVPLPTYTVYAVTAADLASLRPLGKTWIAKSQQDRLGHETILELVAERFLSHPNFIRRLNEGVTDWAAVPAGTLLTVPNVTPPKPAARAAYVSILLAERLLQVFDQQDRLLAQYPCSIAQRVDKRPIGVVRVKVAAENPNYRFDPKIFPESAEARQLGRTLMIQPGPNNPVGVAWIGLDKPGYGIHGTPSPEAVGRTESHGCFRLANWNAAHLLKLIWLDMPVYIEP